MYLLIFEFIGTTEVIFIAIVALIIFGPRKMPDIARQIGKTMNDLRRVSTDFRETWEREVALEEGTKTTDEKPNTTFSKEISATSLAELENRTILGENFKTTEKNELSHQPMIKEIDVSRMNLPIDNVSEKKEKQLAEESATDISARKRDWL